MSLTDRLANRFTKPAAAAVDAPVREAVQQLLKEHGYASPAEVQALRDEVKDARRRADALDARIAELAKRAEATPPADPRVAELTRRVSELEARLASAGSRPVVHVTPPTRPITAAPHAGCKVADCTGEVRSKGFCSPHYQQWRRGTLAGFVGPEGTILTDNKVLHVHARFAGGKVAIDGKKILVDGKEAPSVRGW